MCFMTKKTKKQISDLQKAVEELTAIVKSQELVKLRRESAVLANQSELLTHIHLKVKNVQAFEDQNANDEIGKTIRITFEMAPVMLNIDRYGNVIKNDQLRAINLLDLISIEDTVKVQKVIDQSVAELKK